MRPTLLLLALLIAVAPAAAAPLRILALGDSLTAGYGLSPEQAFPVRLEAALRAKGHDVAIINAGVSGDTSANGLARLDWALGEGADGVIVELGANDMLRGQDPLATRATLDELLTRLGDRPVLLTGFYAMPNLGPDYVARFNPIYTDLAAKHGVLLYPFFLDGVAGERKLNQSDGMHPNAEGVDIIVGRILPSVEQLIDRIKTKN